MPKTTDMSGSASDHMSIDPPASPRFFSHDEAKENSSRMGEISKLVSQKNAGFAPPRKQFMSTTVSATSKAVVQRKKILSERNEGDSKSSFSDSHSHKSVELSVDSYSNEDSRSKPYDPYTNYLTPRPKFLRYKPDRRFDIIRRYENAISNQLEDGDKDGFELEESVEENEKCMTGVEKSVEECEEDYEEEEEYEEEQRCLSFRGLFKTVAVIFALVFSTLYIGSMNTAAPFTPAGAFRSLEHKYWQMHTELFGDQDFKLFRNARQLWVQGAEALMDIQGLSYRAFHEINGIQYFDEEEVNYQHGEMADVEDGENLGGLEEDVVGNFEQIEKDGDSEKNAQVVEEVTMVLLASSEENQTDLREMNALIADTKNDEGEEIPRESVQGETLDGGDDEMETAESNLPEDEEIAESEEMIDENVEQTAESTKGTLQEEVYGDAVREASNGGDEEMEMAKKGLPEEQKIVKSEVMTDGNVELSAQLRLLELLKAGSYITMGSSMLMLVLTFLAVRMILRRKTSRRETETSVSPVTCPEPQTLDKTNLIKAAPTENLKSSEIVMADNKTSLLPHSNDEEVQVTNNQLDSVMNSSSQNHSVKSALIASHNSRTSSIKSSELRLAGKSSLPESNDDEDEDGRPAPKQQDSFVKSSMLSHSIEAAPTDSYRSRSPSISFLGELAIGETSSSRRDATNTKSRIPSLSQEKRTPISELSTMDSPLYGSFTAERETVKKEEGEAGKTTATPVRRSSRLRTRSAVKSP